MLQQNGTVAAHGRVWPLWERPVFNVVVSGYVGRDESQQANETLRTELQALLTPYGLTVSLEPMLSLEMRPADQAEKNALDDEAVRKERL